MGELSLLFLFVYVIEGFMMLPFLSSSPLIIHLEVPSLVIWLVLLWILRDKLPQVKKIVVEL